MVDVFKPTTTTKVPKSDPAIVRVGMKEAEIGGRTSHMPNASKSDKMSITHVPNANGKS